jgi:hypothetical protein
MGHRYATFRANAPTNAYRMKIARIDEGNAERIYYDPRGLGSAAVVAVQSIQQLVGEFSRNEWLPDFGGRRIVGLKEINHITGR